jgi:hypothetical protein
LLRFGRLNRAVLALEEDALTIWFFLESESLAIRPQPGVTLDELEFAQAFEGGKPADLLRGQTHLAWPPATSCAPLAFPKDRHVQFQLMVLLGLRFIFVWVTGAGKMFFIAVAARHGKARPEDEIMDTCGI